MQIDLGNRQRGDSLTWTRPLTWLTQIDMENRQRGDFDLAWTWTRIDLGNRQRGDSDLAWFDLGDHQRGDSDVIVLDYMCIVAWDSSGRHEAGSLEV